MRISFTRDYEAPPPRGLNRPGGNGAFDPQDVNVRFARIEAESYAEPQVCLNVNAKQTRLSLTLGTDLSSALAALAEAVARFGEANHLPEDQVHRLSLALDELVTNSIRHGLVEATRPELRVELRMEAHEVVVQLEDNGVPFDPFEEAPEPDIHASIEDREIGGLGVFLTKTLFPNRNYTHANGFNLVTLRDPAIGEE